MKYMTYIYIFFWKWPRPRYIYCRRKKMKWQVLQIEKKGELRKRATPCSTKEVELYKSQEKTFPIREETSESVPIWIVHKVSKMSIQHITRLWKRISVGETKTLQAFVYFLLSKMSSKLPSRRMTMVGSLPCTDTIDPPLRLPVNEDNMMSHGGIFIGQSPWQEKWSRFTTYTHK